MFDKQNLIEKIQNITKTMSFINPVDDIHLLGKLNWQLYSMIKEVKENEKKDEKKKR